VSSFVSSVADRWSAAGASQRRALLAAVCVAGVLLIIGAIVWLQTDRGPVKGDDGVALAKFIRTGEFERMPSEQRLPYMHSIRQQLPVIEAARREGRIDTKTYRDAYLASWMTRRLDDMQDYYKIPAAHRAAWLDRQLSDKKSVSKAQPVREENVSPDGGMLYKDAKEKAKFEAAKDDFESEFLDRWTPENRKRWEEYRTQYKLRRERLASTRTSLSNSPQAPPATNRK
jgi:hypothetical protein